MKNFSKLRVGVLRGGTSSEYDASLKTGENILSILRANEERYEPVDIFIDKEGVWHSHGVPKQAHEAVAHVDIVWNGLHGDQGASERVQQILEGLKVPYTGAESVPSLITGRKDMAKSVYKTNGLLTPEHRTLEKATLTREKLVEIFRNYIHPVVIKSASGSTPSGIRLAHTFQELEEMVKAALEETERVMVEEYIKGKQISCGVIDDARGEKTYALIPVEITRDKDRNIVTANCPPHLTDLESKQIENFAKSAHVALGGRHYSSSDFILTPRGKVYILETNISPAFAKESMFPKALKATGWKEEDFVDHVINLALQNL